MAMKRPLVIYATGYPMHGDAVRTYLSGFYEVVTIGHSIWHDGLREIDQQLKLGTVTAVIVDDTFPHDPVRVANRVKQYQPTLGLIFIADELNIFKILRCLDTGYRAYLYLGDHLADSLKQVVDHARRGERFLSQTVLGLYERYTLYRGLFISLPEALAFTFKLMGEGLSVQQIVERTGLRPEVVYRRQYRLRQHFGVETNEELVDLIREMYSEPTVAVV